MPVGVAPFPPSLTPTGTSVFYFINQPNCASAPERGCIVQVMRQIANLYIRLLYVTVVHTPVIYTVGLQATFWNMNSSVKAVLVVPYSSFLFECNTERGCIDQLYIEPGYIHLPNLTSHLILRGCPSPATDYILCMFRVYMNHIISVKNCKRQTMEHTWVDTFELIMKGLLVNILGFLGILANILIIIVLRHRKMKSSISLIMMGNSF